MKRVVFTSAVGDPIFAEMALGLARSLKYCGDETKRAIVTDIPHPDWERYFDYVLPMEEPLKWIFFTKLDLLKKVDADQVLWIDSDCLALQQLDPIFDHCAGHGFAIPGFPVRDGCYYGPVTDHLSLHDLSEIPLVTAGMIYYERGAESEAFIEQVMEYGRRFISLGFERRSPKYVPDEPCIALAMAKNGYGHLIPDNKDFIHSAAGLVGKLHLDVLRNRCEFTCHQESMRFHRPRIFHAWRYKDFLIYRRQLEQLKKIDRYEAKHKSMYMPRPSRVSRSIQRRILHLLGFN